MFIYIYDADGLKTIFFELIDYSIDDWSLAHIWNPQELPSLEFSTLFNTVFLVCLEEFSI